MISSQMRPPSVVPPQPTKILQIVPRLPPDSDGVGDYSRLLAQQLAKAHQIETEFAVFRPSDKTPADLDGSSIHRLSEASAAHLLSQISSEISGIIIHYSNYPYLQGKLDAPFWLADVLKTAVHQHRLPLVSMFHELPTLKWKRLRFLNPIQSLVSRQLAKLSSAVVTDSHHFKGHLERWTNASVTCIPDFSTIGEPMPEQVRPLRDRKPRLVVFGGADRVRAYRHLENLLKTCEALGIKEICDIGSKQNLDSTQFGAIAFQEMGFQSAEAVQSILLDSVAGFMDYSRFPGDLGKSSVFAAFCAHGLMPICTAYNPSEPDGIFENQQYAVPGPQLFTCTAEQQQTIASQAQSWYSQHSLDLNAQFFASHLRTISAA